MILNTAELFIQHSCPKWNIFTFGKHGQSSLAPFDTKRKKTKNLKKKNPDVLLWLPLVFAVGQNKEETG